MKHYEKTDREHFREMFRDKSFWEANRARYLLAQVVSYACNLLSILTAFALPYFTLLEVIPDLPGQKVLAAMASITGLIALEMGIRVEARAFFITALKTNWKKVTPWSAIVLVFFFSLSLYSSREGAGLIAEKADQRTARLTETFRADTSGTASSFRSAIQQERADLEAYKKSVSWAGRIDISNPTTKAVIQKHTDRIAALEKQSDEQTASLFSAYQQQATELQTDTERVKNLASGMASLVVLMFLVCMWYLYYFGFRVVIDSEQERQPVISVSAVPEQERITLRPVAPIGFKPETPKTDAVGRSDGFVIRCQNCGTTVTKSRPAKFCSDKCRIENHKENRTK